MYAGVDQRWILVFSNEAYSREIKTLTKNYSQSSIKENKAFKKLVKEKFKCKADAEKALGKFKKALKFTSLDDVIIQEEKTKKKNNKLFYISGNITFSLEQFEKKAILKGKFIIATNHLDKEKHSDIAIISGYKEQSHVERGFNS